MNALQSLDEVTVVIIIDGAIRHVGVSGRRGLHVDLLSAIEGKDKAGTVAVLTPRVSMVMLCFPVATRASVTSLPSSTSK